jgi:hypothetical protein
VDEDATMELKVKTVAVSMINYASHHLVSCSSQMEIG